MLTIDQITEIFFAADEYCILFEQNTKIKRNMKNKLMSVYDKIMLRKRSVIECVMDSLKNICQAEHSRHRSIHGFIINVFAAIGAYHFLPKKPSIASQFQTDNTTSLQLSL